MRAFSDLLTGLVFSPGRNAKLRLLTRYFREAPDPDRGWALAALAGALQLRAVKPSLIRAMVEERVDPLLFRLSYDYLGDLAETVSLIWPAPGGPQDDAAASGSAALGLGAVVDALAGAGRTELPGLLARLFDQLAPPERFALVKLATGGLRVGVSARLAKTALAQLSQEAQGEGAASVTVEELEELWHGLEPPYTALFAWLTGAGPRPAVDLALSFRPMMLAHPIEAGLYAAGELRSDAESDAETLERLGAALAPAAYAAEWKWDGIRVQAVSAAGERRLYSRTGEDIGAAFPDLLEAMAAEGCVDGELLVVRGGVVAPFSELQKRLGRKTVSAKLLREAPAWIRAYDLLHDGAADLRALPLRDRRQRLERWAAGASARLDVSELVAFESWDALARLRADARAASQEGLMLKRWDAPYAGGRPLGLWWKWKRAPLTADCVVMYAQRGHGKRSSFYSDYTFGAWRDGPEGRELTPVGKAYSGFTDEELRRLDKWVRDNTVDRYGPVRAVAQALVFEVAFDAVQRSTRHKSGVAMRFPRIKRIRWDKPAAEADALETLERMIPAG